jgi:hypothetical protein
MTGHIKLDRKILSWEWYQDINTCRLFIHLLLNANHAEGKWQGNLIQRGELITGLNKLSEKTGLSIRQLRTCLDKLKLTGEITIKPTNKFSVITICKYDNYQSSKVGSDKQKDIQNANERQTNDTQTTTNKNEKNNKEEKEDNRGIGDLASPIAPPKVEAVITAADGSLVKIATIEYRASDFNGLPDNYAIAIANILRTVKQIEVTRERLIEAWEIFKTLEIQKKLYRSKEDVYSYFANYCKRQTWAKSKEDKFSAPKKEKVVGVEFINNFNDCRMSDGTIKKLTINQQDSAMYNQINPSSIVK